MLVFVTPHQFVEGICKRLVGKIRGDVEAISLIKGMEVKKEGPCMISSLISQELGINCCVLMGANIANEVLIQIQNLRQQFYFSNFLLLKIVFSTVFFDFLKVFLQKQVFEDCVFRFQILFEHI